MTPPALSFRLLNLHRPSLKDMQRFVGRKKKGQCGGSGGDELEKEKKVRNNKERNGKIK